MDVSAVGEGEPFLAATDDLLDDGSVRDFTAAIVGAYTYSVSDAVSQERHRLAVQSRDDDFAFPVFNRYAAVVVFHFDDDVAGFDDWECAFGTGPCGGEHFHDA